MAYPPSSVFATTLRPCASTARVSGNLNCIFFFAVPWALSNHLPTATIMQCDVGGSQTANILWEKLIAAKYALTVDCWI